MIQSISSLTSAGILFDIGLIIVLSAFLAIFAKLLKQPIIPAYVIAGVIVGPLGLGVIQDTDLIKTFSEIGIMFLLFLVGLEINLSKIRKVGLVSFLGGVLQVLITFFLGYWTASYLGFDFTNSLFLGLILSFSSTMVVIKLLSDKEEIDTLHGRIMIGFLLVQDIIVVALLPFLGSMPSISFISFTSIALGGAALLTIAYLTNKFLVFPVFRFAAQSQEFLFLLSLASCFMFAGLAYAFGFSIAIGAFIGGVALANLPYHYNIIGKVSPLKDFFATIFFVSLGMQITFISIRTIAAPLLIFFLIIVLLKPVVIMLLVNMFGYGKRISFISAIGLAQISEFAFILLAVGSSVISPEVFTSTVLLAVITITLTSYFMKYDEKIYLAIEPALRILDKLSLKSQRMSYSEKDHKKSVLLVGCHRMGTIILKTFSKLKGDVFVVDSNPDVIQRLIHRKVSCIYGDVTNAEVLRRLNVADARILISTIPKEDDSKIILSYAKNINPKIKVIVTAQHLHQALDLYEAGADYVIVPPIMSGERISYMLHNLLSKRVTFKQIKKSHIKHLLDLNAET
ncbi:MAG: cation:proton antiporter [Candidatus Woesearchaeota archaeon]